MTDIEVYPFLCPSDDVLTIIWTINGIESPEFPEIPDWDPATSIKIQAKGSLDLLKIKEQCGLSDEDAIRISFSWYSPGTSLLVCPKRIEIQFHENTRDFYFEEEIAGGLVFGKIKCYIRVSLANNREHGEIFEAYKQGHILLNNTVEINLDTTGSRFPVELIDFSKIYQLPPDAGWFLDWNPDDLTVMALGGIRLYINSHHRNIARAVMMNDDTPANSAIIQIIKFDVARSLIFGAFENENFIEELDEFEEGSVGSYIHRFLATIFPNEDIAGLINLSKEYNQRQRLECQLQEKLKLFQE